MLVCIPCYMNLITPCQCLLPSCSWHSWAGQDAWQRFVTRSRDRNRACDPAQRTDHIHTETERESGLDSVLQWINTNTKRHGHYEVITYVKNACNCLLSVYKYWLSLCDTISCKIMSLMTHLHVNSIYRAPLFTGFFPFPPRGPVNRG